MEGGQLIGAQPELPQRLWRPLQRGAVHQVIAGGFAVVGSAYAAEPEIDVILRHQHRSDALPLRWVMLAQPGQLERRPGGGGGIVQQFKPGLRRLLVAKARHLRLRAFVVPQHGAIDDQLAVGIEQDRAVHLPAGADGGDTRPVFGVARVQLLRTLADTLPPQ